MILVMMLMTMTVVVLHETSQDICPALEKLSKTRWLPRLLRHLLCLQRSITVTLKCNQCENMFNLRYDDYPASYIYTVFGEPSQCYDT